MFSVCIMMFIYACFFFRIDEVWSIWWHKEHWRRLSKLPYTDRSEITLKRGNCFAAVSSPWCILGKDLSFVSSFDPMLFLCEEFLFLSLLLFFYQSSPVPSVGEDSIFVSLFSFLEFQENLIYFSSCYQSCF